MPTTSRGLFHWLGNTGARLEDFADRLNHVWTFGFLLILAAIISWKHGYQKPISCWCPAEFSDSMVEKVHKACWHSYYVTYPDSKGAGISLNMLEDLGIPVVSPELQELDKESSVTTYYQWVPVILCLQALVFKLPHILMQIFHGYSGMEFGRIACLTKGYQHLNLSERQKLANQISRYIYRWCKLFSCGLPWRSLTFMWFVVKCAYCVNVVLQMRYIDNFLKPRPEYDVFLSRDRSFKTSDILIDLFANEEERKFIKSEVFPELMLCKLNIRELRKTLSFRFYCHLHANRFTGHAYLVLWVWLLFVTVVTVTGFAVWILKTLLPFPRQRYIRRLVEISDVTPRVSDVDVARVTNLTGEDGVMALKLIGANSSELFVRDVVCGIVELVKGDVALASPGQSGTVIQQNPVLVSPGSSNITESGL